MEIFEMNPMTKYVNLLNIPNCWTHEKRKYILSAIIILFLLSATIRCYSQAELQAWGNITGIRVQGELMGFETSIKTVGSRWTDINATGKEQQSPDFKRDSGRRVVVTQLGSIRFIETITDLGAGRVRVRLQYTAASDTSITGAFFCISLPLRDFGQGQIIFDQRNPLPVAMIKPDSNSSMMKSSAREIRIGSAKRQIDIQCGEKGDLFIPLFSRTNTDIIEIYLPLQMGKLLSGKTGEKTFILQATGLIDKKEIHMMLDTLRPGREFAGLGGNFRIQNLKTDPQVIDYCLNNLRVAWGRVEMPWRYWQPEKNKDPLAAARSGRLDPHVRQAMEMAKKLQQKGIPVILTDWSAPDWAVIGKPKFTHLKGEPWGNPLNPDSLQYIYKSISTYIQYLQEHYAVQVRFFSFNESDLGIYVRQTGVQHDELIRGLGKYFLLHGLKTKILLGDNSDATTYPFIDPALHDTAAYSYIGAVSFHSWRGWETEILSRWTDASRKINLPLIVAEGSIDAAAWAYPEIFLEQTYAMEEINLYIRLLAICQPLSILQWQLTSDYSPLSGGGIFGKEGPLEPTQRFWNLKQLASTPAGLNYLSVSFAAGNISCAALGNRETGIYVFHITNNGAERKVDLGGIPASVKSFKIISTGNSLNMHQGTPVTVDKGRAQFTLPAGCYTTLMSN
jgi:hypothetical protein